MTIDTLTDDEMREVRWALYVSISRHELDADLDFMDDEFRAKAKAQAARLRAIVHKLEGREVTQEHAS